jgi:hypothetical protein
LTYCASTRQHKTKNVTSPAPGGMAAAGCSPQPAGRPIDPRADHDEWKTLLAEANVRDARLHDARHTAATMLLVLRVPLPAIMEVMGWGDAAVAKRYVHVPTEVVAGIADQVENFLWSEAPPAPKPTPAAQPDVASLIEQLQRLLDTAKTSGDSHDGEEPPGLRVVV